MAFVHGSKGKFALGTHATPGTVVDISIYLSNIQFPQSVDTAETSTLGNLFKTYVPGLSDSTITLDGRFDPTIDAQLAALMGDPTVSWRYDPQGSTTGLPRFTGNAFPTSYQISGGVSDVGAFQFALQCISAITRTTVP